MLHSYAISNFQSFRERVEVDFSISHKVALTDWMAISPSGERLSKLMAVIGPNGSGKTALLKAIAFIDWFVSNSFQAPPDTRIPVAPHAAAINEPTELECMVEFDGKLWRYVLRCTPERVLHEALYQKRERFGYVFIRDWDAVTKSYMVKQQDFGLAPQEARKVRPNVSLIAWAAQFGVPLAERIAGFLVSTNVNVFGRVPMGRQVVQQAAQHFSSYPAQRKRMEQLLFAWDLGLIGVEMLERSVDAQEPSQKIWQLFGQHKNKSTEFQLPFQHESSGTQAAVVLLSRLLQILAIGGLAVIDEFANDLHPHMLEPILDLFANPSSNPRQAQLLFTCHSVEVLNLVHKSQVMLVQKNEDCESSASRLDAVEGIRSDDNLYAKYMAGAYGAVPIF